VVMPYSETVLLIAPTGTARIIPKKDYLLKNLGFEFSFEFSKHLFSSIQVGKPIAGCYSVHASVRASVKFFALAFQFCFLQVNHHSQCC